MSVVSRPVKSSLKFFGRICIKPLKCVILGKNMHGKENTKKMVKCERKGKKEEK
jgi:hypothetical protein